MQKRPAPTFTRPSQSTRYPPTTEVMPYHYPSAQLLTRLQTNALSFLSPNGAQSSVRRL